MANIDPCKLHIPHKTLESGADHLYREDMSEIERWSQRLASCFGGACACFYAAPFPKPILDTVSGTISTVNVNVSTLIPREVGWTYTPGTYGTCTVCAGWNANGAGLRYLVVTGTEVGRVTDIGIDTSPIALQQFQQADTEGHDTFTVEVLQTSGGNLSCTLEIWFVAHCGCHHTGC